MNDEKSQTKYLTFDLTKKKDRFLAKQLGLFPELINEIEETTFDGQLDKGLIFTSGYNYYGSEIKIIVHNIDIDDARKLYGKIQNTIASINRENNPNAVIRLSLKVQD